MPDFKVMRDNIKDLESWELARQNIAGSVAQMRALTYRMFSLWEGIAERDPEGAVTAGQSLAVEAQAQWAAGVPDLVAFLDGAAILQGRTREQLQADIAAAPATSFE